MKLVDLKQLVFSFSAIVWLFAICESVNAADIASVSIDSESSSAQNNVHVTFGHVFAQGEVVDPAVLGARLAGGAVVPLQVDAKATHADGSLRHAVLTTVLPTVAANSQNDLTLQTPGSNATGATVTLASLLATSFDSDVSVNIGGTVYSASARDLLSSGTPDSWLSGPLVSEWLVAGPMRTNAGSPHAHLTARFHVRAYAGLGAVRVSVTLENNWSHVSGPQNFNYDATVSVQGRGIVLSQDNVTHYRQARWRRVFWWGDEPQVEVAHDTGYMERMGVVPTYDPRLRIPQSVLSGMASDWSGRKTELMASGLIYEYMPDGGGRPDIAPLPRWTARYLMSQDARAKTAVLGTGEQAGSFGIHYRDKDTDLPISLDTYPNISIMGQSSAFPSCGGSCSTPYTPDIAHQPSMSFVPYLVTGDYFHLEELQFWANWNLFYWGNHGGSQGLMVNDQIRAQAWGLRTLGHAAFITPDNHPLKAYFLSKLDNNLDWYENNIVSNPPTPLGYLLNTPDIGLDNTFATWMDDFFTWTVGHLVNLGFDNAEGIFQYKARFPVGRMTDPGYCWILAPTYWTRARDAQTGQPFSDWTDYKVAVVRSWDSSSVGPSFSSWTIPPNMSSSQEDPLINAACNSSEMADILGMQRSNMIGGSWSHEGYTSNMQPAVAVAAERRVTNGEAAWNLFDSRAVVPDSGNYDYNVSPQWAIVPGNIDLGTPGPGNQLPTVSLSANPRSIASGGTTTLSWSSSDADSCQASGAWSGSKSFSGTQSIGGLTSDSTFTLVCSNSQGSDTANVTVTIQAPGAPTVSFSSSLSSVSQGSNVTLTWSSQNTDSCSASGAWSGNKATSGSESVGPLSQNSSFTLTCSGSGGNVSESLSVSVTATPPDAGNPEEEGGGAIGYWSLLFYLLAVWRRVHGRRCNEVSV